ncbi:predicted protein [Uncinocarpus reesii 1704]|uniref:DASH complex subunit DAD2 n=1 Tax=Uncinocarpus reesii (strain UAMH 1704) TaxID=336963 RepID=C4JTB0_UNCRE|nr:uncharacterized protein UREG_05699 [Uncinocarpus reesii 1704]EEP80857.1 predicted protein [Uncinocarpus reesii 1704]
MAHGPRPTGLFTSSSLRQPSGLSSSSSQSSSILAARVAAKKAELEDLRQLRDVSDALATQMEVLNQKLETLRDGTEAVACVMANWENVLRAINMASTRMAQIKFEPTGQQREAEKPREPALPAPLCNSPSTTRSHWQGTGGAILAPELVLDNLKSKPMQTETLVGLGVPEAPRFDPDGHKGPKDGEDLIVESVIRSPHKPCANDTWKAINWDGVSASGTHVAIRDLAQIKDPLEAMDALEEALEEIGEAVTLSQNHNLDSPIRQGTPVEDIESRNHRSPQMSPTCLVKPEPNVTASKRLSTLDVSPAGENHNSKPQTTPKARAPSNSQHRQTSGNRPGPNAASQKTNGTVDTTKSGKPAAPAPKTPQSEKIKSNRLSIATLSTSKPGITPSTEVKETFTSRSRANISALENSQKPDDQGTSRSGNTRTNSSWTNSDDSPTLRQAGWDDRFARRTPVVSARTRHSSVSSNPLSDSPKLRDATNKANGRQARNSTIYAKVPATKEESTSQRLRGKELFARDRQLIEEREQERRSKEEAAKRARAEAAQRGRQASREWAERRQKQKTNAARPSTDAQNPLTRSVVCEGTVPDRVLYPSRSSAWLVSATYRMHVSQMARTYNPALKRIRHCAWVSTIRQADKLLIPKRHHSSDFSKKREINALVVGVCAGPAMFEFQTIMRSRFMTWNSSRPELGAPRKVKWARHDLLHA